MRGTRGRSGPGSRAPRCQHAGSCASHCQVTNSVGTRTQTSSRQRDRRQSHRSAPRGLRLKSSPCVPCVGAGWAGANWAVGSLVLGLFAQKNSYQAARSLARGGGGWGRGVSDLVSKGAWKPQKALNRRVPLVGMTSGRRGGGCTSRCLLRKTEPPSISDRRNLNQATGFCRGGRAAERKGAVAQT